MKIACLIFLGCIGYTMALFSPFDAVSTIFQQVARISRNYRWTQYVNLPICLDMCSYSMETVFRYNIKLSKIPFDANTSSFNQAVCDWRNPVLFDMVCDLYKKYLQCVNVECKGDEANDVHVLFNSVEFMCGKHFQDFKKGLPCVYSACNEARSICEPKCQKYQRDLEKSLKDVILILGQKSPEAAKEDIKLLVSIVCRYADCTMNCLYPQFESRCGLAAENLERELMEHTFDVVKEYQASLQNVRQLDFDLPKSCHTLAANNTFGKN